MTNFPTPFGAPSLLARPIITRVPTEECTDPAAFYRRLRSHAAAGSCLLETSEGARPTAARSIVATRCPLRVELFGDSATVTALTGDDSVAAESLLQALQVRLDALSATRDSRLDAQRLVARFEPACRDDAMDDAARLKSPCVLDGLRAIAGMIADDPAAEVGSSAMAPGLFGAFSYEIVDVFEDLPPRKSDPLGEPDASFLLATDLVVFDHDEGEVNVITRELEFEDAASARARHSRVLGLLAAESPASGPEGLHGGRPHQRVDPEIDVPDAVFRQGVLDLKEEIAAGEIFQAVLSRGFKMRSSACPLDVYAALRRSNPSPYMFHMDLSDGCLLGASPETFLRCEGGAVEIRPIAGTVPRGEDEEMDGRLALQLLFDTKEQAEHAMLLDLARNDISRVSKPGTCRVVQQLEVERYSHVQHLVSRVRGEIREDLDALHAFRAAANMGTLTGAPKLRAMELIRLAEPGSRGFYGGAAGYLLQDGNFDSCIVIRSLRMKDGVYHTRAGAGVVQASDPERELQETASKATACIEAVRSVAEPARQGVSS